MFVVVGVVNCNCSMIRGLVGVEIFKGFGLLFCVYEVGVVCLCWWL